MSYNSSWAKETSNSSQAQPRTCPKELCICSGPAHSLGFPASPEFCRQMWLYGQKTQSRSKYQNQQWNGHWPAFWRNKAGNLERTCTVLWEVIGSPSWPVPASAFLPPNLIQDQSCHTATPVPSNPQSVFALWTKDLRFLKSCKKETNNVQQKPYAVCKV